MASYCRSSCRRNKHQIVTGRRQSTGNTYSASRKVMQSDVRHVGSLTGGVYELRPRLST